MNQKGLQKLCETQIVSNEDTLEELRLVKEENIKLKALLTQCTIDGKIVRIQKSDEQVLCEKQISLLKTTALDRELTLEEVKKMDLLVKNLNLSKGKNTSILGKSKKISENVTDAELIEVLNDKPKRS